jgi:hypothetical protein
VQGGCFYVFDQEEQTVLPDSIFVFSACFGAQSGAA